MTTPRHQEYPTKGEQRIRIEYGVDEDNIQHPIARLIDEIEEIPLHRPRGLQTARSKAEMEALNGEIARLKALAITALEEAAMWANKAKYSGQMDYRP